MSEDRGSSSGKTFNSLSKTLVRAHVSATRSCGRELALRLSEQTAFAQTKAQGCNRLRGRSSSGSGLKVLKTPLPSSQCVRQGVVKCFNFPGQRGVSD